MRFSSINSSGYEENAANSLPNAHVEPPRHHVHFAPVGFDIMPTTPRHDAHPALRPGFSSPPNTDGYLYGHGAHYSPLSTKEESGQLLPPMPNFEILNRLLLITDIVLSIIATSMALPLLDISQMVFDYDGTADPDYREMYVSIAQQITPYMFSFVLLGHLFGLHIAIFSWIDRFTISIYAANMTLLAVLALAPLAQSMIRFLTVDMSGLRLNFAVFLVATIIISLMLAYLCWTRFRHELSASKQDQALFRIFLISIGYEQFVLAVGLALALALSGVMGLAVLWLPIAVAALFLIPKVLLEFFCIKGWRDAVKNVLRPDGYGKDRLNSFGDGVYAVSLVLTVLNLKGMHSDIYQDSPFILCHIITFTVLCAHWYSFLTIFKGYTGTINNYLYWFNHLHLMAVALMPPAIQFAILHRKTQPILYLFWLLCWGAVALFQALIYMYSRKTVPRRTIRLFCTCACALAGAAYLAWLVYSLINGYILNPSWYFLNDRTNSTLPS